MTLRSGGVTRVTWAATAGDRPCLSTARFEAQSVRALRTRRGISSTWPPAELMALTSLLVVPSPPAAVSRRRAGGGDGPGARARAPPPVAGAAGAEADAAGAGERPRRAAARA